MPSCFSSSRRCFGPPGSTEDPPDAAEQARLLGHDLIELTEVQPEPLAARALVQLDAPIRDRDQLRAAFRASAPHHGKSVPRFVFGRLGLPFVKNLPLPLELESGEVLVFLLWRLPGIGMLLLKASVSLK